MTIRERMPQAAMDEMSARMAEVLQQRAALNSDDLGYVVEAVAKLKDEKLKGLIAELIGWGDDERAEIESFIAVAIEVMRKTNPSKLREATRIVELRYLLKSQP